MEMIFIKYFFIKPRNHRVSSYEILLYGNIWFSVWQNQQNDMYTQGRR